MRCEAGMPEGAGRMGEAKVGPEFVKHEFDEAIAVQDAIVKAERQLAERHPMPDAKKAIKSALREDEKHLEELQELGGEHGATGKVEEVAGGLKQLMQDTASKAAEAESEAYEATAVLLNLKRKQQDSASAMLEIARTMKDTRMRDAASAFHDSTKESAEELAEQLAAMAVKIATTESGGAGARA
jgi:hypothetical protein